MMETLLFEGVHERLYDVRLPDELVEPPRPPFQRKNLVAQEISSAAASGPRQPYPGTQRDRYRCSLPGLTGFTACCRGGTDADLGYFTSPRGPRAMRARRAGAIRARAHARVDARVGRPECRQA